MVDDARLRRMRRNEEVFRAVNERIARVAEPFASIADGEQVDMVCECAATECTDPLRIRLDDYRAVRDDPDSFVVLPGHERDEIEDVVRRGPGYLVVRKRA